MNNKLKIIKKICKYGITSVIAIIIGCSIGGINKVPFSESTETQKTIEEKTQILREKENQLEDINNSKEEIELQLKENFNE